MQSKCKKCFTSIFNLAIVSLKMYLAMSLSVVKVFLTLRNIYMAPSTLSGNIILLYMIEDIDQLSYPQWFTEIRGNSCKHCHTAANFEPTFATWGWENGIFFYHNLPHWDTSLSFASCCHFSLAPKSNLIEAQFLKLKCGGRPLGY